MARGQDETDQQVGEGLTGESVVQGAQNLRQGVGAQLAGSAGAGGEAGEADLLLFGHGFRRWTF